MSKGIVCVGGGEQEHYDLLDEKQLRPIINVEPSEDSVYHQLEQLVLHPERLPELKRQSVEYVRKHHNVEKVAKEYERLYLSLIASPKCD
jgi:glycosyltransferase involved in cell wall biosynthesis